MICVHLGVDKSAIYAQLSTGYHQQILNQCFLKETSLA